MDYLSFITIRKLKSPQHPDLKAQDYIILNSTVNVSKAIDTLNGYDHIHCFLDNDKAGITAYREMENKFAYRVRDASIHYAGYKDLNDFLCNKPLAISVNQTPRTMIKPKKKGLGL